MSFRSIQYVDFYVQGINAKTVGSTVVWVTNNSDDIFIPVALVAYVQAATAITVGPTISLGTNSPSYNDIFTAAALTVLTPGKYSVATLSNGTSPAADTQVFLNLSIAASGTSMVIDVHLFGYYL